jgi:transposase
MYQQLLYLTLPKKKSEIEESEVLPSPSEEQVRNELDRLKESIQQIEKIKEEIKKTTK